jgi:hypothetical protein
MQTRAASPLGWRLWWQGIWAHRTDAAFNKRNPMVMYTDGPLGSGAWKAVDGTTMTIPLYWTGAGNNYTAAYVTSAPTSSTTGGAVMCVDSSGWPHFVNQDNNVSGSTFELYYDGAAWQSRAVPVQGVGAMNGGGIACLRGNLWYVTSAFDRIRLVDQATHRVINVGGPCENGSRAVPEPMGQRDNSRLTFAIPNGDLPAVYDTGVRTRGSP